MNFQELETKLFDTEKKIETLQDKYKMSKGNVFKLAVDVHNGNSKHEDKRFSSLGNELDKLSRAVMQYSKENQLDLLKLVKDLRTKLTVELSDGTKLTVNLEKEFSEDSEIQTQI